MSSAKVVYPPAPGCVNGIGKLLVQVKGILPPKCSLSVRCSQQKEAGAAASGAEVQDGHKQM